MAIASPSSDDDRPIGVGDGAAQRHQRQALLGQKVVEMHGSLPPFARFPHTRTRFRPASFAAYIAASARSTSLSRSCPGACAPSPIETVTSSALSPISNRLPAHRDPQPLGHGAGLVEVRLGEHDQELLAAVTSEEVVRPERLAAARRDLPQHLVAGLMAVGVVDPLEVIGVDHRDRERAGVALGSGRSPCGAGPRCGAG